MFSRVHSLREPVASTRLVRVPVVARRRRSRSTKVVPVTIECEEEYLEIEEHLAVRRKEVWVKKLIEEQYTKRTPVRKTRKVQRRTSLIVEEDDLEEVAAYRVDEIDEVKERETRAVSRFEVVEQDMPMMQTLPQEVLEVIEHDPEPGSLSARRRGHQAFMAGETGGRRSRRIRGLDIESLPVDETVSTDGSEPMMLVEWVCPDR